ncbi:MAG: hypothetical protein JWO77_234 [Ilumatobacteraceae bacterium]|nr:hypothetical protein [Ilumatobacteraceae bacterium]
MSHIDLSRPGSPRTVVSGARARWAGLAAAALCGVILPVTASSGQAGPPTDPKGNNGTVKVDGAPWDDHPDNEPHPGCAFQIDFYGFDEGVGDAQVTFALQAPTTDGTLAVESGDLTPAIGGDAAGGGTDLDASETYKLGFTGAPAKQGYHVKLTVHAPGSIGADTKHKVFWVSDCDAMPEATTTTTAPLTTTTAPAPDAVLHASESEGTPSAVEGRTEDAAPAGAEAATTAAAGAIPVQGSPALTG